MFRRLLRWLFTAAAAFSLLLFLAAAILWPRSYFVGDHWSWYTTGEPCLWRGGYLWSGQGRLRYTPVWWLDSSPFAAYARNSNPAEGMQDPTGLGVRRYGVPGLWMHAITIPFVDNDIISLTISYPLLLTLTAPLPALWLFLRLRRSPTDVQNRAPVLSRDL